MQPAIDGRNDARHRGTGTWIAIATVALLALAAYVAAGPYLTVRNIRKAVEHQDARALSAQVDFPALRDSLKAQLADRLVRRAGADAQASKFGAVGLAIASDMLGAVVDTMVTPVGLAAMIEGHKVWDHFDKGLSTDPAGGPPSAPPFHGAVYRYESLSRFTATIRKRDGRPIVFVLTRNGVQWRLSDIRLPD